MERVFNDLLNFRYDWKAELRCLGKKKVWSVRKREFWSISTEDV